MAAAFSVPSRVPKSSLYPRNFPSLTSSVLMSHP